MALVLVLCVLALSQGAARQGGEGSERALPGAEDERVLILFGVVTRDDPRLTHTGYQPLMDYLTQRTPYRVDFRRGRSSEDEELDVTVMDLVTYLEERNVEVAPLGPLSYLLAEHRFGAVPIVKRLSETGEPLENTFFLVKEERSLQGLDSLRGGTLAMGPSHSTWGHLLARHELGKAGVTLDELERVEHLPNDRAVIDAVATGQFDAGAVRDVAARRLGTSGLRILHVSDPIPSRPLVVRKDLPAAVVDALRKALLELPSKSSERDHWDAEFRFGFAPASPSDYEPVRRILHETGPGCAQGCHQDIEF